MIVKTDENGKQVKEKLELKAITTHEYEMAGMFLGDKYMKPHKMKLFPFSTVIKGIEKQ